MRVLILGPFLDNAGLKCVLHYTAVPLLQSVQTLGATNFTEDDLVWAVRAGDGATFWMHMSSVMLSQ